jgi:phosphoribosylaminoimidazolecarboxamide formyltransferase / IMP cyclohydrolase
VTTLPIGRALISVSDKTGLIEFATELARLGVKIVSTGGTATALRGGGISVRDVSEITGYPELFDGRVKTLHPAIHGGILYRRAKSDDEEQRHRHGIVSLDLVVVNLYPFEQTVSGPSVLEADAVEQIDVGGPALIRAAAKNHAHVLVVVSPDQYGEVIDALRRGSGTVPLEMARRFARAAFARTSAYDAAIARFLDGDSGGSGEGGAAALPERLEQRFRLRQRLRYGENPGQEGALYASEAESRLESLTQLRGKTLSFNNFLDVEAALRLLHEFDEPTAVVVKHRNPSGVATAGAIGEAVARARDADRLSAFGGIVGLNRPLDAATIEALGSDFYEVALAPAVAAPPERIESLRKNMVLLEVPDLLRGAGGAVASRSFLGGLLAETTPAPPAFERWNPASKRRPTSAEEADLRFGWRVTRHVISNAIVIARDGRTLGIGAGQSSRVDAVRLALWKAERSGHDVRGAVLCSDAFFPFGDSVTLAGEAGIAAVAQPGGSVRDGESIAAADAHGIAMVFTGERCFLH